MACASVMFIDKGGFVGPDSMIFYTGHAAILRALTEMLYIQHVLFVSFIL